MVRKFTNTWADGEITGNDPDAEADFYKLDDFNRDHNYWQAKIAQGLAALAADPTKDFYILSGGLITDSGSGQIDVSAGTAIGQDADGNVRILTIPALTNVPMPSGWNNNRQIWLVGTYEFEQSTETRQHFNGETYHYVLKDSYVGHASTDLLFVDADPGDTVVIWGSFRMNGTTFTYLPEERTRDLAIRTRYRGTLIGGVKKNGNNPPTLRAGVYDVDGTSVEIAADTTASWASNSMGDTAIESNYWYLAMIDAFGRYKAQLAYGDNVLASTAIQAITSVGGGVFRLKVLNAVDLSGLSNGMVATVSGTTSTANSGVFAVDAFDDSNDSGGAGYKYIDVRNSSGVAQAGVLGSVLVYYRIESVTTAADTIIYSPSPTFNAAKMHYESSYDASFRPIAAFYADGSGVVTDIINYGSGIQRNDDLIIVHSENGYSSSGSSLRFATTHRARGENMTLSDSLSDGTRVTAERDGFIFVSTYLKVGASGGAFSISKNLNNTFNQASDDNYGFAGTLGADSIAGGNAIVPVKKGDYVQLLGSSTYTMDGTSGYNRMIFRFVPNR